MQQLLHRADSVDDFGDLMNAFSSMALHGSGGGPGPGRPMVLLAAPSNTACDVVAERLLQQGLPPSSLMRINSFSRDPRSVPLGLRSRSVTVADAEAKMLPVLRGIVRGVAMTCITAQRLGLQWEKESRCTIFSHVVVRRQR